MNQWINEKYKQKSKAGNEKIPQKIRKRDKETRILIIKKVKESEKK